MKILTFALSLLTAATLSAQDDIATFEFNANTIADYELTPGEVIANDFTISQTPISITFAGNCKINAVNKNLYFYKAADDIDAGAITVAAQSGYSISSVQILNNTGIDVTATSFSRADEISFNYTYIGTNNVRCAKIQVAYEKVETGPDAAIVEAFTAALDHAAELGELYLQSIPFAGQEARKAIEVTLPAAQANIELLAAQFTSADDATDYVNRIIAETEAELISDLNANAGQPWALRRADSDSYLGTTLTATDEETPWSFVPTVTVGRYYMNNYRNQYISTPVEGPCTLIDALPAAPDGAFTLGVKDGYVTINSVAHNGCALALDGDTAAAILPTDTNCYWQVAITGIPDSLTDITIDADTDAHLYDLLGRPVTTPTRGLYIINNHKYFIK